MYNCDKIEVIYWFMARLIDIHSDERVLFVSYVVVNIEIYFISIDI